VLAIEVAGAGLICIHNPTEGHHNPHTYHTLGPGGIVVSKKPKKKVAKK
jgi:hypothetical protein